MTHDDEDLAERAARGDQEAFGELVMRYQDRVYTLARRLGNSAEDAQDATQDTFLRAWRALPRFRKDARFSTWLYRIASRRALDVAVRRCSIEEYEADFEEVTVGRSARGEDSAPGSAGQRRDLERLIGTLSPMQRAAITLFYYQDRSVREVSVALGLPEGTVKTHLHRARAVLRRRLEAAGFRREEYP